MQKYIEKLQFITHDIADYSHLAQVEDACAAGAKWIQYRCFSKSDSAMLQDIHEIASVCDDWGTTLIVTDHTQFAGKADIQGFHIEDMAADFVALRKQLGAEFTLGGSANTIDNLIRLAEEGADYAGFGPFSYSETKANTYPLVTLEKYASTMSSIKAYGLQMPVIGVGGITLDYTYPLLATGIYGVAVSAGINRAADPQAAFTAFYRLMHA